MEALVHTANLLYLTSYLVRDILVLRALTVTAALCLVGYFHFRKGLQRLLSRARTGRQVAAMTPAAVRGPK